MKIIRRTDSREHVHGPHCIVREYEMGAADIDGAVIELSGRYPETGRVMNSTCKLICYIIKGEGRLEVNGKTEILAEGDMALIEPKEKYYWDGVMTVFISSSPAWNPDQYIHID